MKAKKTFTVEVADKSFDVEVVATGHKELYGADADGNRGIWVTDIDELDYDLPKEIDSDDDKELFERELNKQIERQGFDWSDV